MRIPGCAHEVEPVRSPAELRAGQTVYGACYCGRTHCAVLTRRAGERRRPGGLEWWEFTPPTGCRLAAVDDRDVARGRVYRLADPRAGSAGDEQDEGRADAMLGEYEELVNERARRRPRAGGSL